MAHLVVVRRVLAVILLAAVLSACSGLSDAQKVWCGDIANRDLLVAAANTLGAVVSQTGFFNPDDPNWVRACQAAYGAAH
jgi:hypothetical protein